MSTHNYDVMTLSTNDTCENGHVLLGEGVPKSKVELFMYVSLIFVPFDNFKFRNRNTNKHVLTVVISRNALLFGLNKTLAIRPGSCYTIIY